MSVEDKKDAEEWLSEATINNETGEVVLRVSTHEEWECPELFKCEDSHTTICET